jgi:hypothetical protein
MFIIAKRYDDGGLLYKSKNDINLKKYILLTWYYKKKRYAK